MHCGSKAAGQTTKQPQNKSGKPEKKEKRKLVHTLSIGTFATTINPTIALYTVVLDLHTLP